jgi:hypothetical protein
MLATCCFLTCLNGDKSGSLQTSETMSFGTENIDMVTKFRTSIFH